MIDSNSDLVARLRNRNIPFGYLELMDKSAAEIERLRDDLNQAMRQWRMYAESHNEVDLEHDDNAEALLYRQILAGINQQKADSSLDEMVSGITDENRHGEQ